MMKKIILLAIIAIIFTSCVKSLEEEGITFSTRLKGRLIDKSSFEPIPNIVIQVTNGSLVYTQTETDYEGVWSLDINVEDIDTDYYLLLCESSEYASLKGQLRGFGQAEYDYTDIMLSSKYSDLLKFSFGGVHYSISSNLGDMPWDNAMNSCNTLSEHGYSDWFLPNKEQLKAMCLSDYSLFNKDYWSSTEYNTASAYYVRDGNINYGSKSTSNYVRCIRKDY